MGSGDLFKAYESEETRMSYSAPFAPHRTVRRGPICSSVRLLGLLSLIAIVTVVALAAAIHAVSAIKLVFGTARKDEDPWRWAGRDTHPLEYIEAPH
jgi:hypothetical protein